MVNFKEMAGNAAGKTKEALLNLTEQMIEAKKVRVASPEFLASIERMRNNRSQEFGDACEHGKEAAVSAFFGTLKTIGIPWFMLKEGYDVWKHNKTADPHEELPAIKNIIKTNADMMNTPKTLAEVQKRSALLTRKKDIERRRQSFLRIPAKPVVNILKDYANGAISATKMLALLTSVAAKSGVIIGRKVVGY